MSLSSWFGPAPRPCVAPLETRHAAALAKIHARAFARAWEETEFERLLADRAVRADGLFARESDEPLGFVVTRRVLNEAEILSVAVVTGERGRGHARARQTRHLEALVKAGTRCVHLEVEEGNGPALTLYRRLGFREVGRRIGYYRRPDGSEACALTMSIGLP